VGHSVLRKLIEHRVQVLAISVSGDHVHLLGRLPHETARKLVGLAKAHASHAIRDAIPGVVFAKKCKLKPIRDREHHVATFGYISDHREEGAWIWTFREPAPGA
jgi:REP element-mobilizing transposase RayT